MKQAVKKTFKSDLTDFEKKIAKGQIAKRECSVQEAAYLLKPELWLRKPFLNNNLPESRYSN